MVQAFKEWQVICDALASGRQTILIRKGGIHEGRSGFSFAHESFYLFPTKFHAQLDQVREETFQPEKEWQEGDMMEITHHAEAIFAVTVTSWDKVQSLLPFHIYAEKTLEDRFYWEGKGMPSGSLHVAFVKVTELKKPWDLPYEKRYGGCRSWLELPEPPPERLTGCRPVLEPTEFDKIQSDLSEILRSA
ncbi:MAG: DUF1802 family protein [Akkermansiaceae bacterium]